MVFKKKNPPPIKISHDRLTNEGLLWLSKHTVVAGKELGHMQNLERPDIIGWTYRGQSYVIEVKTSKEDYEKDRVKISRTVPGMGMGVYRLYLAPEGIIDRKTLPNFWGLLEFTRTGNIKLIKKASPQESNLKAELPILLQIIRFSHEAKYNQKHNIHVN